jgi:hypothetical protein
MISSCQFLFPWSNQVHSVYWKAHQIDFPILAAMEKNYVTERFANLLLEPFLFETDLAIPERTSHFLTHISPHHGIDGVQHE